MLPGSPSARLFVILQHLLPQHTVSRVVLVATRVRWRPFKDLLISAFVRGFKPRMDDAVEPDPLRYASFNEFFIRTLRPGARPQPQDPRIISSPVDGTISQLGRIADGQIVQSQAIQTRTSPTLTSADQASPAQAIHAKGRAYSLAALLAEAGLPGADPGWTSRFEGGAFATLYLAPYNYHRIHMPRSGTLAQAWFVPGRLFSVNAVTAAAVDGLFARNERVLCAFESDSGPFAMALVGALNVGSITTVWHGDVAPRRPRRPTVLTPSAATPLALERGAEMGRFNMGSTVILLFPPGRLAWLPELAPGTRIRVGQPLARLV